jgi:hypothetical protein
LTKANLKLSDDNKYLAEENKELKQAEWIQHTKIKNMDEDIPPCDCFSSHIPEPGPYYTHLGVARNFDLLRSMMEY